MFTFLFEEDPTLRDNYRYISIYIAFSLFIREGYSDIRILDAVFQWNAEYANRSLYCIDEICQRMRIHATNQVQVESTIGAGIQATMTLC